MVLLAKDTEDTDCLCKLILIDDIPEITEIQNYEGELTQIYFYDQMSGYMLIDHVLYFTEDFGATLTPIISDVSYCSFYDKDNFMYIFSSGYYCTADGGETSSVLYNDYFFSGDFFINFAPGLSWSADTWDGTSGGTTFSLCDVNRMDENPVETCTVYLGSPDGFIAYAYDENQLYFVNSWGKVLYTLDNDGYTYIEEVIMFQSEENTIYPNPTHNYLQLDIQNRKSFEALSIFIYDIMGRLIQESYINDINETIDVSNLKNGLYTIVLLNGADIITAKFIKE